jgi:hypothetical protein
MNSEKMHSDVLNDTGNAAKLAESAKEPHEVATALYHLVFARKPDKDETELVVELLTAESANRRQVIEDLMWAMLNSAEFVFQD